MIAFQIICWTALFLIFFSYVLFPFILEVLGKKKKPQREPLRQDTQPFLSVLLSVYNEEKVIERKLETLLNSSYLPEQIEILIGSDASDDQTNEILESLEKQDRRIRCFLYRERMGKPNVINRLAEQARGDILIITDANVMLSPDTLTELARPFGKDETGLVDSRMINTELKKDGISYQEKFYISREVRIKYLESILWGTMMGPFGGCYAVRRSLFKEVPHNFLVDDFYINMSVLDQGYHCISNLDARVYEDVSNDLKEEFRRKKRISAGNFQNLIAFSHLLWSRQRGVAFTFFSHKIIRWMVPFIVIISFCTSLYLATGSLLYRIIALLHLLVVITPIIDFFLRKIKIHSIPLRFISHFVLMNLALLAGFFRFIRGIKSNVWEPTKRYQR